MYTTYVVIHAARNIGDEDVPSCSHADNIKVWPGVGDLSWRIVVIGKVGMLRYYRPNTTRITDSVLLVWCLTVVLVGTGRIVVTKMHRLILIQNYELNQH